MLPHQTLGGDILKLPDQIALVPFLVADFPGPAHALHALSIQSDPDIARVLAAQADLAIKLAIDIKPPGNARQQLFISLIAGAELAQRHIQHLARLIAKHARRLHAHSENFFALRHHQPHWRIVHQRLQLLLQLLFTLILAFAAMPQRLQGIAQNLCLAPVVS